MDFLNMLKLDSWWKVVLWSGIALIASALIFEIEIINRKHLIGLGFGMFLIGIANFAALGTIIRRERVVPGEIYQWTSHVPIHNKKTKVPLYIGFVLTVVFGVIILWNLLV